jgi:hypothetical protein
MYIDERLLPTLLDALQAHHEQLVCSEYSTAEQIEEVEYLLDTFTLFLRSLERGIGK